MFFITEGFPVTIPTAYKLLCNFFVPILVCTKQVILAAPAGCSLYMQCICSRVFSIQRNNAGKGLSACISLEIWAYILSNVFWTNFSMQIVHKYLLKCIEPPSDSGIVQSFKKGCVEYFFWNHHILLLSGHLIINGRIDIH